MSKKQIGLWCVFVDFVALTGWAVYSEGYLGFVAVAMEFAASSVWGAQILVDFVVALTIALGWMVADARRLQLPIWPYVALTLTLGSIGPLAYLIHRERVGAPAAVRAQPAVQHA